MKEHEAIPWLLQPRSGNRGWFSVMESMEAEAEKIYPFVGKIIPPAPEALDVSNFSSPGDGREAVVGSPELALSFG